MRAFSLPRMRLPRPRGRGLCSFGSIDEYKSYLEAEHAALPQGFSVGTSSFKFTPAEAPHLPSSMTLTLLVPDEPTALFAAAFTRNAFPGAPVKIGRQRLQEDKIGAIIINNKISNVCAKGGGVADSEQVCSAVASALSLPGDAKVIPCSTGVIGWRLPVSEMVETIGSSRLLQSLQSKSLLPAAEGIMTTDLYPKVVGTAKGAGMIEPNMATMLAYVLTDIAIPRQMLRKMLSEVVEDTFNSLSVDSDQSTSDTVVAVSSGVVPFSGTELEVQEVKDTFRDVCLNLSEKIVRNGEGCNHLMRVRVTGAPDKTIARGVGKAVVNSPLFKCAVAGNDPNVGRLASSIGDFMGSEHPSLFQPESCVIGMGGRVICRGGEFILDAETEAALVEHMKNAEQIRESTYPNYPPTNNAVEITVDLGLGDEIATVLGSDLTHEYVSINADYRS